MSAAPKAIRKRIVDQERAQMAELLEGVEKDDERLLAMLERVLPGRVSFAGDLAALYSEILQPLGDR